MYTLYQSEVEGVSLIPKLLEPLKYKYLGVSFSKKISALLFWKDISASVVSDILSLRFMFLLSFPVATLVTYFPSLLRKLNFPLVFTNVKMADLLYVLAIVLLSFRITSVDLRRSSFMLFVYTDPIIAF